MNQGKHYEWGKKNKRPLRLYLAFKAAYQKEKQGANAIYHQASDEGIFDARSKSFIKQEPANERTSH